MTDRRGKHIRTDETKAKMRDASRKYDLETPWGYYRSAADALAYLDTPLAHSTLLAMCLDNDRIVSRKSFSRNRFLQTLGPWVIGKTFREIGFSAKPK